MAIAWMHLCPSVLRTIPHRRQPRRMFEDPSEASSISTGKQEAITNKRLRDDGTFSIPSPPRKNHVLHSMLESENFCMLSDGHYPHTISNLAELRWKLERRFRSSPSLLDQFIEQLTSFLDDDDQLRKALQPALTSLPNDRFQSLSSQESEMVIPASTDSLIRSLLGVPSLQQRLITLILEKLPEFCEDQESSLNSSSLWTDVPRMILFQLRYLDVVCNEKQLCEKLLDLLRVCPVLLQREILIAIPDIVTDSSHPRLVEFLQELLRDDVSLTVHILDTLSNLNLSSDLMDDLRGTAVHALETSPIDDLPVIIRFVMHSCTKKDAETTISSLLRNLKFIGDPRTRSKTRCESLCLVIEQLRNGILYHKQLSSAFIKCLQTMIADDVSPIAVWSLFVVNELPHFSGKAVITLKHWLASDKQGAFTNSFEEILSAHPDVVSMLAKSSLGVAEEMLRSADVRDQDIAETIYTAVFTNTTLKPDTLNCIIAHIGSGKAEEVDRALLFLLSLCTHYHEQIRPSLAYIQSLLDYCHNLSNFQLRTLFQALAKCLGNDVSSSTLANSTEVLIYIKKNLHQPHFLFQRAGIIGALCYINACVSPGSQFDDDHEIYPLLVSPLSQSTAKSYMSTAFLCDEILYYLNRNSINIGVIDRLLINIVKSFLDTFMHNSSEPLVNDRNRDIQFRELYEVDETRSSQILILPSLYNPQIQQAFQMLSSQVELLHRYSLCDDAAEEDEDGYSSMPLILFDYNILDDVSSLDNTTQSTLFSALLHSINWFRSILNAFASSDDIVMQWKCTQRLLHLLDLHAQLQKFPIEFISTIVPLGISDPDRSLMLSQKPCKSHSLASEVLSYRMGHLQRPFATTVYTLLSFDLCIEVPARPQPDQRTSINPHMLRFLLVDLHATLKSIFLKSKPFGGVLPSSNAAYDNSTKCVDWIDFLKVLGYHSAEEGPNLHRRRLFSALGLHMKTLCSNEVFRSTDSELTDSILQLIITCMSVVLKSPLLQTRRGQPYLSEVLSDFKQCQDGSQLVRAGAARSHVCRVLLEFISPALDSLAIPVQICEIVHDCLQLSVVDDHSLLKEQLSAVARELLTTLWKDHYKLAGDVNRLIKIHIANASDPIEIVRGLIDVDFRRFSSEDASPEEGNVVGFSRTLTKATWPFFFKACSEQIATSLNITGRTLNTFMSLLETRAKLFASLLEYISFNHSKSVLSSAIVFGQVFMDGIIKHLPLMKKEYNNISSEIISVIMCVQKSTRKLQVICNHVKRERVTALVARVPALKKSLETFIYKIKELFFINGMLEKSDFKCGTLKHRAIDGSELREEDEEEVNEEEEKGEDDPEDAEKSNDE